MKASCLDMLLIVAFRGVADIITGKWTSALRACHLITTVLLQDFFQSGTKTYQELREYKEAVREAPLRFTYESLTGAFLTTPRAERALVIGWQE